MKSLKILWQFSRPHTIIGSTLSILSIFAIAVGTGISANISPSLLPLSLLSALTCNIYITGLNQWSDVAVDRINKPWLPIAAGTLSKQNALRIVLTAIIGQLPSSLFYIISHSAAMLLFLWQASVLNVANDQQVKRFYLFFWGLFFLEYLIYPIGFYLPC